MTDYPSNYLNFNAQQTKNLSLVLKIDGFDTLLTSSDVYVRNRYGDPIVYGQPGIVYGGLRKVSNTKSLLSFAASSTTITQRLEPEQGRASISTLSLSFLDKDEYMTNLLYRGGPLDEPMGKLCLVYLGYQQTSYPEDYFVVFRGRITDINYLNGLYSITLSDPNFKRKQQIFYTAKTSLRSPAVDGIAIVSGIDIRNFTVSHANALKMGVDLDITINATQTVKISNVNLTTDTITVADDIYAFPTPGWPIIQYGINATDTTVKVNANADFYQHLLGPDGTYDPGVKTYIKINDEIMQYSPTGYGSDQFTVTRAQRGTFASVHNSGDDVEASIEITDHVIDMALKLMLSSGADWRNNVSIYSFVDTTDPLIGNIQNAIILPDLIDAKKDYGINQNDFITVAGSAVPANNLTAQVVGFGDLFGQSNRIVLMSQNFTAERPSPAKLALRSYYDRYPLLASVGMSPEDVDIETHLFYKTGFLSSAENKLQIYQTADEDCKTFIESQLMLVFSMYTLTRFGRLSCGMCKPPFADIRLQVLDKTNVVDPQNNRPRRALNNRAFWNEITYDYDYDDGDNPKKIRTEFNSESVSKIGVYRTLPIHARGAKSAFNFQNVAAKRSAFLLNRYKFGVVEHNLTVNFQVASTVEVGDVVAVNDNGELKLVDFQSSERNIGAQLYEVVERNLNIQTGQGQLKLLAGLGGDKDDKFATIAPSSNVALGSTVSTIKIKDSFGAIFPTDEGKKWRDYLGLKITVHDYLWTRSGTATLDSFKVGDPYLMQVSPALSFVPQENDIVELANYPTNTSKTDQQLAKQIHAFLSPQVAVVTGIDGLSFTVAVGDETKFTPDCLVLVHKKNYSIMSEEIRVLSIVGQTITLKENLGFTPDNTYLVDLIGFMDGGAPYRIL